jgi:hypothetical protein
VRALVLLLVFANLALLAWTQLIGEPSRRAAPPDPGAPIPRLQLASEAGAARPASRCTAIGPFADQAVAERAVLWLRGERREPRLRTTRRDAGAGYWVMIDTPSMQQAARVSMRLRAAGVADVEVLPPAADATRAVVSLGIYGDRTNADRRVEELRRYAVDPQVIEQPRSESTWWIDVDLVPGASPVDVGALERAVPGARGLVGETCPIAAPSDAGAVPPASAAPPPDPATAPTTPPEPDAAAPAPATEEPPRRVAGGRTAPIPVNSAAGPG